jgi:hypothetical protein
MRKKENRQLKNPKRHQQKPITVDGYEFETILPAEFAVIGADFEFGIRIHNRTTSSQRFLLFFIHPILFQKIHRGEWDKLACTFVGTNGTWFPNSDNCHTVQPKESIDFLVRGNFSLRPDGHSHFSYKCRSGRGYYWPSPCKAGEYQIQCGFYCHKIEPHRFFSGHQEDLGDFWLGEVVTCPVNFKLVESPT